MQISQENIAEPGLFGPIQTKPRRRGRPSKSVCPIKREKAIAWARREVPVALLRMRAWTDEQLTVIHFIWRQLKNADRPFETGVEISGPEGQAKTFVSHPTWFNTLQLGEDIRLWTVERAREPMMHIMEDVRGRERSRPKNKVNRIRAGALLAELLDQEDHSPSSTSTFLRRTVKNTFVDSPPKKPTESKSFTSTKPVPHSCSRSGQSKSVVSKGATAPVDDKRSTFHLNRPGVSGAKRNRSSLVVTVGSAREGGDGVFGVKNANNVGFGKASIRLWEEATEQQRHLCGLSLAAIDASLYRSFTQERSRLLEIADTLRQRHLPGFNPHFWRRKINEQGLHAVLCLMATIIEMMNDKTPPQNPVRYLAGFLNKPLHECDPAATLNDRLQLLKSGLRKDPDQDEYRLEKCPVTKSSIQASRYWLSTLPESLRTTLYWRYRTGSTVTSKLCSKQDPEWVIRAWIAETGGFNAPSPTPTTGHEKIAAAAESLDAGS